MAVSDKQLVASEAVIVTVSGAAAVIATAS